MSSQGYNPCQGHDQVEPPSQEVIDNSNEVLEHEGMKGFRKRAHKQFLIWKDAWVKGVRSRDDDPIFAYGHMIKYLIEPDQTPFLDLLGGGGFMPHGHGNTVIGQALVSMRNQAVQTSDRGDHVYAATAEFMMKAEEHLGFEQPAWQFANSENEAFLLLMEAFDKSGHSVLVVNGPKSWPQESSGRAWSNIHNLSPGNLLWKQVSRSEKIALVVYPVNPETFEVVDHGTLGLIESIKSQKDVTLVWDLSVSAGWTREPLDVNPNADAVLLGGSLGGGMSFGAVVSREPLQFPESGRWSATAGNALVTQMGLHALLLSEGDEVRDRYDLLVSAVGKELETIQTMLPEVVREITGGGLLGGFRLSSTEEAYRVFGGLRDRGVLVGSLGLDRSIVTFRVARTTDPHDVSELFDKVFEILTEERKE